MRDTLDDLLDQVTLLTLAGAIALGYAVLSVAQGAAALAVSLFTERESGFDTSGALSLAAGDRRLEFAPLVIGAIELVVVLAAILYVIRPGGREPDADV